MKKMKIRSIAPNQSLQRDEQRSIKGGTELIKMCSLMLTSGTDKSGG